MDLIAKSAKTGARVDFKETHGLLCKIPRNNDFNAIEDGGGFKRGIKGGKMKAMW
jgi:hypothetical protein